MWKLYQVVFRLRSPLHVGHIKVGNLMRTRPYVLGKTIWGAVTAALAVERFDGDFPKAQQQVSQLLAFSYFYPALEKNDPLWPQYTKDGLCYGATRMSAAGFERRFLFTYGSTALDYTSNTAAEGSLHEVEFISPYDTQEGGPVYLVGYILERQGNSLAWRDVLSKIRLGGERKSGWGQVTLEERPCSRSDLFGIEIELEKERPWVKVKAGECLRAHALATHVRATGQIEPLVGRETHDAARFGGILAPQAPICWVPGSQLLNDQRLEISEHGIWR
jgi:hypothetical protein